jgi:hypothetical protein
MRGSPVVARRKPGTNEHSRDGTIVAEGSFEVAAMSSFVLCSPQQAFLGVVGLLVCGLFSAEAMESSPRGAESLAATHEMRSEPSRLADRTEIADAYR